MKLGFKKHLSVFIFYSLANVLNKGLSILALPILSGYLSIDEFGLWSLSHVSLVVIAPLISFNGYASVLREGVGNRELAWSILKKYLIITSIISLPIALIGFYNFSNWIFLTLLLACVEAYQVLLLGWYRSQDKHVSYFLISLIKIVSIILAIYLLRDISLVSVLQFQLLISGVLLALFMILVLFQNKKLSVKEFNVKSIIVFSLLLIPHNISLWILSSSDRYIIKSLVGDYLLGIYSVCYSIGLVIMLLNTGIALVLPNYVIKSYTTYMQKWFRFRLILAYSAAVIVLNVLIFIVVKYLKDYFEFLKPLNEEYTSVILWVVNGLYLLGIYYFYSNVLFYQRKAKLISASTLIVGLINIGLTLFFVPIYGIYGAAITTFISYLVYLVFIFYFAQRIEKKLKDDILPLLFLIIITLVVNYGFFNFITP